MVKLTLVSILYQGKRHSFFVQAENGKISQAQLAELTKQAGVSTNACYGLGY